MQKILYSPSVVKIVKGRLAIGSTDCSIWIVKINLIPQ
jgi:hypothetical protein